jgi:hypothetical protein
MATPDDIDAILERIANHQQTDADIVLIRQKLAIGNQQNVVQLGKYNVNIEQGQDIQIGDRTYTGPDAETIKALLHEVIQELVNNNPSLKTQFLALENQTTHNQPINTHQEPEIRIFLRNQFPNKNFRGLIADEKHERVAWEWLQPDTRLEDLERLQRSVELNYPDTKTFARELSNLCRKIVREAPELEKWVRRRVSLLEYEFNPPPNLPQELLEVYLSLRFSLNEISRYIGDDTLEDDLGNTEMILDQALASAAYLTHRILGSKEDGIELWANLMLPLKNQPEALRTKLRGEQAIANYNRASQLWEACSAASKVLVVLAETNDENKHIGFWIPIARSSNHNPLPGAPTAYSRYEASAVFRDDLPSLDDFSPALETNWRSYRTHLTS